MQANADLNELRMKRVEVAEKLGNLRQSSSKAWKDLKEGFSSAFVTLQISWEKAKREFDPT